MDRVLVIAAGYANEVGESFRALIDKKWVQASYGIAFTYVLADTVDKSWRASDKQKKEPHYSVEKVIIATADTLIWQTLASVAIPGFTINRLCLVTLMALTRYSKMTANNRKWTTTAVGLGSIPFIVKPIDKAVDILMDNTFRKWFGYSSP